jgi:predicted Zn-dependent peptidase
MSSRLFQELREDRGLAYSVSAWSQAYADTGIVTMSCAADRNRAAESMHLAREVLAGAVEGLTDAEVLRARAQLEAGLLMSMESAQGRADQMARSIEVFGRILSLEDLLGQLQAVDAKAACEAGAALLDGRAAVASVGAQLALAA